MWLYVFLGLVLIHVPVSISSPYFPPELCRSSCMRNALFKRYTVDFVLMDHVLATVSVQSSIDCMRLCIEEPRCQSFNCEHVTTPTLMCELNHETKVTKPFSYVGRTGFVYYDAQGPGSGWCSSICSSPSKSTVCYKGYAGLDCRTPMKSCQDWLNHGFHKDGVYHVIPGDKGPFPVYCDQTTDDGGWCVVQRRKNGSVDFYRTWNEYKTGFGDFLGEFWLGNDHIHLLTTREVHELWVDLGMFEGANATAKYSKFSILNEDNKYRISVSGYSGTAGDSFGSETGNELSNTLTNDKPFSTWDRDHDSHRAGGNCAAEHRGAWWFNDCYWAHLNGPYKKQGEDYGINWYSWAASKFKSLKRSEMRIRPKRS